MRTKNPIVFALVMSATLLMVAQGFAQINTGAIRGTVKDETGEPLPGVAVEANSEAMMGKRTAITDAAGSFRFPALPIGKNYEVSFTLSGFQTLIRKDLRVEIGATVVLAAVLKPATLEKEINVIARPPLVDTVKSSFSSNLDSSFLESLPTGRGMHDIIAISPGISPPEQGSTRVSSFGSLVKDNAYYLNGTDISAPSTGAAWLAPQLELTAEMEVTGIGAPAEYGNFQGAVINVVSKSGSNKFHGTAEVFLRNQSLTANNTPKEKWPYHVSHWHDVYFTLGGPLIKDKLWFFVLGEHTRQQASGVGADPASPAKYELNPVLDLRLDYQLNPKNKISLFAHYNKYQWGNSPTQYRPYETISAEKDWVYSLNADWLSTLNSNTYFELKFASWRSYLWYDPLTGDLNTPGRIDWGTGYWSKNSPEAYYHWWTNRIQVNTAVSHFAEDFIKGDHDFKFGVQFNRGYSDIIEGYWGGVTYIDWMGYPYAAYVWNPEHIGGLVHQLGAFVDDSWRLSNRLTLNLGLRFDYSKGSIPAFDQLDIDRNPTGTVIPGINNIGNWKTLSPRIGLNYQLTADMKTVFRATYGRYSGGLKINDFYLATPARSKWYMYGYNWGTGRYDQLWSVLDPLKQYGLDPNLKRPFTDQFSVALEREIFQNFSMSATCIYKSSGNIIARTNTAAQYEEIPFYDAYGDQTIMVYNQVTPIQNFRLITNPGDKMTYKALMLVANKRFSNNYQFYFSFTWSKAWQKPKGFLDKNALINAEGPPGYADWAGAVDRRWQFKFAGSYSAPLGIILGTNITYQQGLPWQRTVLVPGRPTGLFPGLNQGAKFINAEPRGSRRFPNELYLDLKVEKQLRIWSRLKTKITFDIFNLLNQDTNLQYVSTLADSPNFMVPTGIVLPRMAMFGFQLVF